MTDRAAVVAKITEVIRDLTAMAPAPGVELLGHEGLDSLDIIDIELAVEDEFFPGGNVHLAAPPDCTVDKIADLVMAALAKREATQ